jgi:hypothetical protein
MRAGLVRRAATLAVLVGLAAACASGTTELSPSGKGLPQLEVDFIARARGGSVHTSELTVRNPGPGDIATLAVSFARVGAPAAEGLPNPLVDPGLGPTSGTILRVRPRPASAAHDVVYRFGSLAEDGSMTISFRVRVPQRPGPAASSVMVYDDTEPERASGVRLETVVEG